MNIDTIIDRAVRAGRARDLTLNGAELTVNTRHHLTQSDGGGVGTRLATITYDHNNDRPVIIPGRGDVILNYRRDNPETIQPTSAAPIITTEHLKEHVTTPHRNYATGISIRRPDGEYESFKASNAYADFLQQLYQDNQLYETQQPWNPHKYISPDITPKDP
jgi:hypothetical protein